MRAHKADGERVENCAGTNHGVLHVDRWLAQAGGKWDVIQFNFGLHDLKRVHPDTGKNSNDPGDPHQADPARYEAQLRSLVTRLKESGARLIFATTTPVPAGGPTPGASTQLVHCTEPAALSCDSGDVFGLERSTFAHGGLGSESV